MITTYTSAYGCYEVPRDILVRSIRLKAIRPHYLEEWSRWQYEKACHG